MDENTESSYTKIKSEALKGIFKRFTCRVCLFRDKGNLEIKDSLSIYAENISKHLCFQIGSDDVFPMWICKFCQQSLQSFHNFYIKVTEIQGSLSNLISTLKKNPPDFDETPKLDTEFDAIDLTVGFGRGKQTETFIKNLSFGRDAKSVEETPPQRVSTRSRSKKAENVIDSKNCSSNLLKVKKERETTELVEDSGIALFDNNDDLLNDTSSIKESASNAKASSILPTDGNYECVSGSEKRTSQRDEDLSSIEDQDWIGQGFSFDIDSDGYCDNDTDKRSGKLKRKKSIDTKEKKTSEELGTCKNKDASNADDGNSAAKKLKFRITATHGTGPKPKLPPCVKQRMRNEINSKFVEFYGISCDICTTKATENSVPVEPVKFDSFVALCDHMKTEHNVRGYVKCCNCTMRDKKRAEKHMLLHTEPGSIYKCNICGKQLSTHQSFKTHLLLHLPDNERPYQCNQCDRGFATKPDLTAHERQHLPEDERLSFTCDICGNRFGSESALTLHTQRVHEDHRPFLCDLCAKSYKTKNDMERHKAQTHGEVKREQCQECGKWFKGRQILKTHMRRHMGTVFPCEHCDKTYSIRSSWKAHMVTHSDEKRHICPVCSKAFKLPGTLKMHLNQHTGEHPYSCQFCPKTFASSGNYYTHRKRMHPNEVAMLKKNTEAALVANGVPPSPMVRGPRLCEVLQRVKEKVAAQTTNENVPSHDEDIVLNDADGSTNVSMSPSVLTEKNVLNNVLPMSPNGVSVPVVNNVNFLAPNDFKVIRIISSDGTAKYAITRKSQGTLNLTQQSQVPLDAQEAPTESGVIQGTMNQV